MTATTAMIESSRSSHTPQSKNHCKLMNLGVTVRSMHNEGKVVIRVHKNSGGRMAYI